MGSHRNRDMLQFKLEQDGDELHAWCPELPGCHSHGRTRDEALANLKDAVRLYLDDVMEEQMLLQDPKPSAKTPRKKRALA